MSTEDSINRPQTVSHFLGEMVWLLTQSPLHNAFSIKDLEWMVMPALAHQQFYVFRDGPQPVGLALWAMCDAAAAQKVEMGMLDPKHRLTPEEWKSGDKIWLVDMVCPFATVQNQQREIMMADLIYGPLNGKEFNFHQTDPGTGERVVQTVDAAAGEKIREQVSKLRN